MSSNGQEISGRVARLAALLSFALMAFFTALPSSAKPRLDQLTIVTASGEHTVDIEVAETEEDKALGLMFRTSLGPGRGMLFPYPGAQEVTMWMRNTLISLDMVFIRADGTVHRVEEHTEPMSERLIQSQGAVAAVLELDAGAARRLGIVPGSKVRHRHFGSPRRP